MTKNIEVRRINIDELNEERLYSEARGIKESVYQDFRRLGVDEHSARSFANPDDDDQVEEQMDKMLSPAHPGTVYAQLLEDEEGVGYAKVGPRRLGDEVPFGGKVLAVAKLREVFQMPEMMPRGLHVMAVRQGLALAALEAIYHDLVPPSQRLIASVHAEDEELHQAFTALGSKQEGPKGEIKLGGYTALYVRRSLPPHKKKFIEG